jgi:hypothetical protein
LIEQLAHERDDLARALKRYGRHDDGCDPATGCGCGLGPLLDAIEAESAEPDDQH